MALNETRQKWSSHRYVSGWLLLTLCTQTLSRASAFHLRTLDCNLLPKEPVAPIWFGGLLDLRARADLFCNHLLQNSERPCSALDTLHRDSSSFVSPTIATIAYGTPDSASTFGSRKRQRHILARENRGSRPMNSHALRR
jgi:hypothetical protein